MRVPSEGHSSMQQYDTVSIFKHTLQTIIELIFTTYHIIFSLIIFPIMRARKLHSMKRFLVFSFVLVLTTGIILALWLSRLQSSRINDDRPDHAVFDPLDKIDWHDLEFILEESKRKGNGEHGKAGTLPPDHDKNKYEELFKGNEYNGLLSDYISVNRSVPDSRPRECQNMKYRRHLPEASIVIPIHNEHWSTLFRTIYSILNRSPKELIKEIILVDDGSTKESLKKQLDDYVASNVPKVRVLHIPEPRQGLMAARTLGAKNSTGEVLIFADAHLEVNVNWLPPLLEPIAENYKACVCPVFDVIDYTTYEYKSYGGIRGVFDWEMRYQRLPLLEEDNMNPTRPYKTPVMLGALSAMSSRFFWELGGYDPELRIWGGEQYELSFKVWQCGGILVDAPCSKVAHMYREKNPFKDPMIGNYVGRNHHRVAEVWMDEYAQYVYMRKPDWEKLDAGDLSERREIRKRLECKPFKWFMEEVAFDLIEKYPLVDPPNYGSGRIIPLCDDHLCLTVIDNETIKLQNCTTTKDDQRRQEFLLSWRKYIRITGTKNCLDIRASDQKLSRAPISTWWCQDDLKNQLWRYNLESQQLVFGQNGKMCLSHDTITMQVYTEACDQTSDTQRWTIDSVDKDALKKWDEMKPIVR